jgi:DNA-binding beta-propeller fold protein YncE
MESARTSWWRRSRANTPALLLGALLGVLPLPTWAAACVGSTPTGAVPAQFLHGYWAFLRSPTRLAIDAHDNVYITDPLNGRVVVRAPSGRILLDGAEFGYPISIAVDSRGAIYVGDGDRGRVDVYDPAGQPLAVLGQGDGEFVLPAFLAVYEDTAGPHVFVVDSGADMVKRYAGGSGALETEFGGFGNAPGQLTFPSGIAVAEGKVHVVDRGNSRVQTFSPDGDFLAELSPPSDDCGFLCGFGSGRRGRPRDAGIWIGPTGEIYLAEASKGQIIVLSGGNVVGAIGGFGASLGRLRVPTDVVIDSCGRLFVAAAGNGRVEIFGLPGHVDPERFVPGRLDVADRRIDPQVDLELFAMLEIPGYRVGEATEIVANGFAAPVWVEAGDADRDTIPDLTLVFGADLVASLAGTAEATITVSGRIAGLEFEESDTVQILVSDVDADEDGVAEAADACPDTPPGEVVGADGCALVQRCPCAGTRDGEPWRNHGAYVECISAASRSLVGEGVLTRAERGESMRQAARSACAKPGD